jgi:hypothetical protein
MNDISVIKFKGQSKLTLEGYVGYFLITKDGDLKYDVLQYPLSLSSFVDFDVDKEFKIFQRKIPENRSKIIRTSSGFKELNSDLERYIKNKTSSDKVFKDKMMLAIKNEDLDVLNTFVTDFFDGWVKALKISVTVESMSYSDLSKQLSKIGNTDETLSILKRNDLQNFSEAYPIVDPISGKSINNFDVGEKIYFTVLRFSDDKSKDEMIKKSPNAFNGQGENISPLVGRLISKEFVPELGEDFTLIKIESQGNYFKALVLNSMNLMTASVGIPTFRNNEGKNNEGKNNAYDSFKNKKNEEEVHVKLSDVLVSIILVGGIIGTVMTIIYFLFTK